MVGRGVCEQDQIQKYEILGAQNGGVAQRGGGKGSEESGDPSCLSLSISLGNHLISKCPKSCGSLQQSSSKIQVMDQFGMETHGDLGILHFPTLQSFDAYYEGILAENGAQELSAMACWQLYYSSVIYMYIYMY